LACVAKTRATRGTPWESLASTRRIGRSFVARFIIRSSAPVWLGRAGRPFYYSVFRRLPSSCFFFFFGPLRGPTHLRTHARVCLQEELVGRRHPKSAPPSPSRAPQERPKAPKAPRPRPRTYAPTHARARVCLQEELVCRQRLRLSFGSVGCPFGSAGCPFGSAGGPFGSAEPGARLARKGGPFDYSISRLVLPSVWLGLAPVWLGRAPVGSTPTRVGITPSLYMTFELFPKLQQFEHMCSRRRNRSKGRMTKLLTRTGTSRRDGHLSP
jgi:hypothetical protein